MPQSHLCYWLYKAQESLGRWRDTIIRDQEEGMGMGRWRGLMAWGARGRHGEVDGRGHNGIGEQGLGCGEWEMGGHNGIGGKGAYTWVE